jgi:Fe-S cluster assembly ATPase SufC
MTRPQLELLGVSKLVNEMDTKEAARLGLMTRPLTTAAIEKHLNDFGLEPEFGTHSLMKGLSGGQKVKVVLAAAMWNNPHILVMDEPTNFLDRDSLGALAMVRPSSVLRITLRVLLQYAATGSRIAHSSCCCACVLMRDVWRLGAGHQGLQRWRGGHLAQPRIHIDGMP